MIVGFVLCKYDDYIPQSNPISLPIYLGKQAQYKIKSHNSKV